nr:aminotransferase class I/II-fold pyridoxal phosphate-dependent enzyme [uncultured Agathobaculum sp.]
MLFFENDYGYGAHPKVLEHLMETNMEAVSGYGNDKFTASAAEKIKKACSCPEGQVYFLTGGTQTNMVVIDTLLRPYEGVVASSCGHVNTHEAGAIESTGHKVLTVPHKNGKLDADDLRDYVQTFYADASHDHMVFPGMVYISHPSEYGTVYTKNELERISAVCHEFDMPLFLDGARLGYGLASDTDVTLADIARLTDVFYIGGTKCGALCGEAVVFTHGNMPRQFDTMVKRRGAMLAKARLNAVQFDALFTDGLYEEICAPAVHLALRLRDGLAAKGYRFSIDSPTNQQFLIMENDRLSALGEKVKYSFIEKYDAEHTVIRLATSWATTEEQVDELLNIL